MILTMNTTSHSLTLFGLLALTACSQAALPASTSSIGASAVPSARETFEAAGPTPRLVVTHDGGVTVVDATSGKAEGEFAAEGFTRLNQAGDGRHLLLTEGDHFRVLDSGAWSRAHGDHSHSYKTAPLLTDVTFDGEHPGHAVFHGDRTALFYDGEGRVEWFEPTALSLEKPQTQHIQLPAAHHGVALWRDDDTFVHTVGTEDARSGVAIRDAEGKELTSTEDCPGVHGEASVKAAISVGCEDGILIIKKNVITKVESPDAYGRIGNQAGTEASTVVLGDYKVDKDAELERPTRISLTDTATGRLRLVDLGASYSFRSLGRGPAGEALVLGTDGKLRVIDPANGKVTRQVTVVKPWTEPLEWQQPRPTLYVQGAQAWVSEPASKRLHRVDLATGKVGQTITLTQTPNELNGVVG